MRFRPVYAFIIKELKHVFRDKSTLFWVFAWPVFWIIMASLIFIPPSIGKPYTIDLGIVNHDSSNTQFNGTTLVNILNESTYQDVKLFNVKIYLDESKLIEDVRNHRIDAGMVIPEDFGEKVFYGSSNLTIYVYAGDVQREQLINGMLSRFIDILNSRISKYKIEYSLKYIPPDIGVDLDLIRNVLYGIAKPVNASVHEVKPKSIASRGGLIGWYTFGAIGMVMLYTGFDIGSIMIIKERDLGTLNRILSSPVSFTEILLGKTIGGVLILCLSAFVSVLVGLAFGAEIYWNPLNILDWLLILDIILTAIFTIGVGLIISLFAKSSSSASGVSVVLGLILSFITGIWLPKWMLPKWMQVLADYFPATWGIEVIRRIVIFRVEYVEVLPDIFKLFIAAIATYLIGAYIYNRVARRYAEE